MAVLSYWSAVILSGNMSVLFSRFASCESVVESRMFVPGDVLDEVCVVFMVSTLTLVVSIVISLVEVDGVLAVSLLEVKITDLVVEVLNATSLGAVVVFVVGKVVIVVVSGVGVVLPVVVVFFVAVVDVPMIVAAVVVELVCKDVLFSLVVVVVVVVVVIVVVVVVIVVVVVVTKRFLAVVASSTGSLGRPSF